jgi:hypothetical protein
MVQGKKEEDSINILIGFILIVFVALALLWAFSGITSCPEGTFSCDETISSCGCCIEDAYGNPIESCDFSICPSGTYYFEGYGCCPTPNPASCLEEYKNCKNLQVCGEGYCCGTDICEIQSDGSHECIPCSAGSVCNPENVNSCCAGYACNEDGFCENIKSCVGMKCSNYNQPCEVCGADSTNCIGCEDNSMCLQVPGKDEGVCKEMCDSTHPVCLHCPSGCCDLDGSCATCLGNPCTSLGEKCNINNEIGCEEVCVMYEGSFTCLPTGGCPTGTYFCNLGEGCKCCDIDTGSCYIGEDGDGDGSDGDDDVCVGEDCIVSPEEEEGNECPEGYVYFEEEDACLKSNSCVLVSCDDKSLGESCSIEVGDYSGDCDYVCKSSGVDELACFPSYVPDEPEDSDAPNWLLDLEVSCVEFCEDCKNPVCPCVDESCDETELLNSYDLNSDGTLDDLDLEFFDEYYMPLKDSEQLPLKVSSSSIYDINNDNIIDENDRACLLEFCGDGTCRYIGFQDLGICVTAKYYDSSFTEEQKVGMGSEYKTNLYNIVESSNNGIDCSTINSRNKPFCDSMSQELKDILLVRNLSYVNLDRGSTFFYSACGYANNIFDMYLESTSCSNEINIYHSKDFYYKNLYYGMSIFNNCVKNTDKNVNMLGTIYEGNCISYSDDVTGYCVVSAIGYNGFYDCNLCNECKAAGMVDEDCSKYDQDGTCETFDYESCSVCPDGPGCTLDLTMKCVACELYEQCVRCDGYYPGSAVCDKCDNCRGIGDVLLSSCNNQNTISSIDNIESVYSPNIHLCYENYPQIKSSNCMIFLECMDKFNDKNLCVDMAIQSYWLKDNNKFSKQLYCYYDTVLYEGYMSSQYIKLSENLMYSSGEYSDKVEGTFMGFVDNCPFESPVECIDNCINNAQSCVLECLKNNIGETTYCTNKCTVECIENC